MTGFAALGLNDHLLGVLAAQDLHDPTPIQAQAIPPALAGRDVIGLAQTGTGKTAAYGLPLVQRLMSIGRAPAPGTVRALVLAPTRELAGQIAKVLKGYARFTHVKVALATGGASMARQAEALAPGADILVATPGRLIDLMKRQALSLESTRNLVLDEADQMLALGFLPSLKHIAEALPDKRQTLLFSATMPAEIETLAATWLADPVRLAAAPPGKPAEGVEQAVHFVSQREKAAVLRGYLEASPEERALVFCRTRDRAEKLAGLLAHWGFAAAAIHGDRTPAQRGETLARFRTGDVQVLVATDLAARGLDVPGIGLICNHDVPARPDPYIHRIGRTARAGATGRAVTLCAPSEIAEFRAIEAALGTALPVAGGTAPDARLPAPTRLKAKDKGRRRKPSAS